MEGRLGWIGQNIDLGGHRITLAKRHNPDAFNGSEARWEGPNFAENI
jgi:hypothetical protein